MSQGNELTNIIRDLERMENSENEFSDEEWSDLHGRIIQLPRTDRRKLYEVEEYLPLENVLDRQQKCRPEKRIKAVGNDSKEDIRIAIEISKRVAVCMEDAEIIECDAVLVNSLYSLENVNGLERHVGESGRFHIWEDRRFPVNYIYAPQKFQIEIDEGTVIEFLTNATQSGNRSLVIGFNNAVIPVENAYDNVCDIMAAAKWWLEQNYNLVDKIIFCADEDYIHNCLKSLIKEYFPVYEVNIPESKLPAEILRMDRRSIEIFKKALSDGKHVVHNIRVMLVGHSGVGKTTILKRLLGQEVDIDKRESTDGIEVHVHRCKVDIDSGQWTLGEDGAPDPNKVLASSMLRVSADKSELPPVRESSPQPGTSRGDHTEVTYTQKQNSGTSRGDHTEAKYAQKQNVSSSESDTDEPLPKKAKLEVHASSEAPTSACGSSSTSIQDSTKGNETQLSQTLKEVIQASNNLPDSKFAKVSFWDFAGQSIFYNTHQVFLTPRTIFLLVTSLEQDIDDVMPDVETVCLEKNGTKVRDFVDFWANSVRHYCGKQDTTGPPIILVATHADTVDQANKKDIIDAYFQKIRDIFDDKVTAEHIEDDKEYAIDNTGVDSQLKDLKSEILKIAKKQDYWKEEYPNRWLTFEKDIFNKRQSGTKIMKLEEVKNINRIQPIPLEESEELDLFLRLHNDQGALLYFSEQTLNDYILLDPQWVVDALKSIITADCFLKRKMRVRKNWGQLKETGKLTMDIIDEVWGQSEFIKYKDVLLKIMERLSLIAKPKDDDPTCDHYFVPCFIRLSKRHIYSSDLNPQHVSAVLKLAVPSKFFPLVLFNKLIALCVGKYPIHQNNIYNGSAVFENGVHVFTVLYVDNTVKVWVTNQGKINPNVCQDILDFLIVCMKKLSCNKMASVDVCICCPKADLYSVKDMIPSRMAILPKDITQWKRRVPEEMLCSNPSCGNSPPHLRQDVLRHWIHGSQAQTSVLSDPVLLARCPTQQEIVRMSTKTGTEFSLLGIMLGITKADLEHVALENHNKAICQINAMLNLWLTRQGAKATIGLLKKAMKDVGIDTETVLAQSLETSCADVDN